MTFKERFTAYYSKKSKISIASDILFVMLILAMLVPQSRMKLMSLANKGRMLISSPTVNSEKDAVVLKESDYQIVFSDLDGNILDFSTLKGKVIFLNFWATWCPPCVAEMPSINELYNMYKDNTNVAFLMVTDEKPEDIKNFKTKKSYNFPAYINNGKIPETLKFGSIPTTFVISKTGKIIIREVGSSNWSGDDMKKTMDKLINE